jgi:hypothetical protein
MHPRARHVIANQRNQTKINQKNEPFISKTKTRLTNRKFPQTSLINSSFAKLKLENHPERRSFAVSDLRFLCGLASTKNLSRD